MPSPSHPLLALRAEDCAEIVRSPNLFALMLRAGWIKPVVKRHKLTLYDHAALEAAWARIVAGEWPSEPAEAPAAPPGPAMPPAVSAARSGNGKADEAGR